MRRNVLTLLDLGNKGPQFHEAGYKGKSESQDESKMSRREYEAKVEHRFEHGTGGKLRILGAIYY